MNRICKPGPIVTSVAAIIITSPSQLESDYPASFRVTAVPSVGPSDTLSTSVSGHLVADTMAIESPDNETSWRGSMMSRLPWEVDHRQSDSHTSICDRLPPTTISLDPETSTEEEQKNQSAKNVIADRVSSFTLHVGCKHFSYHTYFQLMGWDYWMGWD